MNDELIALRAQTDDSAVLNTKMKGALILDELLRREPLDLFVLFSSYRLVREAVDVLLETVPKEVDLDGVVKAIDGIDGVPAQTLISEIGVDMSAWPTEAHFASWLGLCPDNQVSKN